MFLVTDRVYLSIYIKMLIYFLQLAVVQMIVMTQTSILMVNNFSSSSHSTMDSRNKCPVLLSSIDVSFLSSIEWCVRNSVNSKSVGRKDVFMSHESPHPLIYKFLLLYPTKLFIFECGNWYEIHQTYLVFIILIITSLRCFTLVFRQVPSF